ncbi:hypothetical protein [Methylobacterium sp. NEAU K]|uniref:hypothetical protein n=1 Tax=Methylobacterium sp. NEAU K TaxID=3064946 RepID=UPI0027354745|nr:hypothetical protein [Methylobacterium sp. NEAU K]MDP4006832.1 hypothetical protein [Methylobacterium sp. NEAU K]
MGLISIGPLTEAATFTLGCILLRTVKLDQGCVGAALGSTMVVLFVCLLIALTSESIEIDPNALDPAGAWQVLSDGIGVR